MKLSRQNHKQINNDKIKSNSSSKTPKEIPLKNGESYKGKLMAANGDKVSIKVDGKEYSATLKDANLAGKAVGDQIEFTVNTDGQSIEIAIKEDSSNTQIKLIDNLMLKLGVEKSNQNKMIVNLLKEFKIPITKENFEEIKSLIKSKDLMISTLDKSINNSSNGLDLNKIVNKELSLKDNLINIFKTEASSVNQVAADSTLSNPTTKEAMQSQIKIANSLMGEEKSLDAKQESSVNNNSSKFSKQVLINEAEPKNEIEKLSKELDLNSKASKNSVLKNPQDTIIKKAINDHKLSDKNSLETSEKDIILKSSIMGKNNEEKLDVSLKASQNEDAKGLMKMIDSLKNIDESSFAFNKEMQIPNVLKNLVGFDNLINMKDSVVNQLRNVLGAAFEHGEDKTNLTEILKELIDVKSDDFESINNLLEKTKAAIDSQNSALIDTLKEDINLLKESIDYIKDVNEQLVYMQTPIDINGEIRDFEMGIKKSKDFGDGSFKIFISLDTANIGLVQSLIKIKDTEIDIAFKVEKEFDKFFSDNHDIMSEELISLGYTKINLSNLIREKRLNLTDLMRSEVEEDSQFNFLI